VDIAVHGIGRHHSQQPQNHQNHEDCHQHLMQPPLVETGNSLAKHSAFYINAPAPGKQAILAVFGKSCTTLPLGATRNFFKTGNGKLPA
jgi:hypothetical protein